MTAGLQFLASRFADMKNDRQAHGIGFENMKKTAEKYGGTVDYSVAGYPGQTENAPGYAIFTLSVMLRA